MEIDQNPEDLQVNQDGEKGDLEEKHVVDELPEVVLDSEMGLRTFLEAYRQAMIQVFNEKLGWDLGGDPDTRCGITSIMTIRALYEKQNVVDLQLLHAHRASFEPFYPTDTESMIAAQQAITRISRKTGKSSEVVRRTLLDFGLVAQYLQAIRKTEKEATTQDPRIRDYLVETIEELVDAQPELVDEAWAFYEKLLSEEPNSLERITGYLESGWEHTVVLLGIEFSEEEKRTFVIDANSEQFGDSFDQLFMFDLKDAVENGYTMENQGSLQGKIDIEEVLGDTERLIRVNSSPHSYRVETEIIPKAQVSRMIAEEYRQLQG